MIPMPDCLGQSGAMSIAHSDSVQFRLMSASDFFEMAMPLLSLHRDELATDKALMVLKPDFERYEYLDECGALLVLGAFRGDRLIGYSANIIASNLHYSDLVMCQNDVLFLVPEERKGMTGIRLIRETERLAKERGAMIALWHAKLGTSLDKIMPKLGASVQDVMWRKVL